jgi:voltage-gated sodium channel
MPRLYVVESALARFMESKLVHYFIGLLILVNAGVLLALTYYQPPSEIHSILIAADKIILGVFVLEIVLRLIANGRLFFKSPWNVFDFIVIFGSALPLGLSAEIMRSLRVLRLFYFIEISSKMRHILQGLYKSLPGIANVTILLIIIFVTFSILGVLMFPGSERFADAGVGMHTLFQVLSGDDWYNVLRDVQKVYAYAWVYFYLFYVIMVFVILNLFIGVVVGALQAAEEDLEVTTEDEQTKVLKDIQKRLKTIETKIK